ncbi:MAG TPA: hypothetical protein VGV12_15665 [Gemmatimonadales bacterium]|nr:hypothetical protein [Gemmatimonadales bacterium]
MRLKLTAPALKGTVMFVTIQLARRSLSAIRYAAANPFNHGGCHRGSLVRRRWFAIGLGACLQLACGNQGPISLAATGNFAGSYAQASYLSLSLHDSNGTVSGAGWTTYGGPIRHLLATGTSEPNLRLQLDWDVNDDGLPDSGVVPWRLSGNVDAHRITAELTIATLSPMPIVLERVDTAASGTYEWAAVGGVALDERGSAGFNCPNVLALALPTQLVDNGIEMDFTSGRPQPGQYTIAPYPAPLAANLFHHWQTGSPQYWQAVGGLVWIDVSTSNALIGRFTFTATAPTGLDTVVASGSFSAGGASAQCH